MKTFKKILCTLLVVVMCLTSAPLQGFVGMEWPELPKIDFGEFELPKIDFGSWFGSLAKATTITDQCGDNVYYTYDTETQELVVSGSGAIWDYEMGESPASDVAIKSVVIEEGITSIGKCAFYNCDALTDIIIPVSLISVGDSAFLNCKSLTNVYYCGTEYQAENILIDDYNEEVYDARIHLNYYEYTHEFTSDSTKEGSCNVEGIITYTCNCGCIYEETTPKINHTDANIDGVCDNCSLIAGEKGSCGENLIWCIFENQLLIQGTGTMDDYEMGKAPFYNLKDPTFYNVNVDTVVIEEGVSTIGDYAFYGFEYLESITLPDSIIGIGHSAFKNCYGIKNISLSNSLISIGDEALYGCYQLESIFIPYSISHIGKSVFKDCSSLKYINVDENNMHYSSDDIGVLFDKDKTIIIQYPRANISTSYTIPDSVVTIEDYAFYNSYRLEENIIIPDSVITIGNSAFEACYNIKNIVIGDNVTYIEDLAFADCQNIAAINIPDSVTTIGEEAFNWCTSLATINIGKNVKSICRNAFNHTAYINDTANWIDNVLYIGEYLIKTSYSAGESYTIKDGTSGIADYAFYCDVTEVVIPDSIRFIGKGAFNSYYDLKTVNFVGSEEQWNNILIAEENNRLLNSKIHFNCYDYTHEYTSEVTKEATCIEEGEITYTCTCGGKHIEKTPRIDHSYTSEITKEASCSEYGERTYICSCGAKYTESLPKISHSYTSEVTKEATCTEEGETKYICVCGDNYIEKIAKIDHSYTSKVTKEATCTEEGEITYTCICGTKYTSTISITNHINNDNNEYCDCCGLKIITHGSCGDKLTWTFNTITGELVISGKGAMKDYDGFITSPFHHSNIKSVIIESGVTTIGDWAFVGCDSLTNISIPNGVTTIGHTAFCDCDSLTSISIPNSVKTIDKSAFSSCDSLTSISIPDSVTTIGDLAFSNCYSLTSITVDPNNTVYSSDSRGVLFNKNKTVLNWYPVGNTNSAYIIPDSVTKIRDNAFYDCDKLTSISIPDSVKTIGKGAFSSCDSLTSITIGNSVTTIDVQAFYHCDKLTSISIPDSVKTIGKLAFLYCYSLTDVYYNGTEEQWKKITIGASNDCLTSATIHYNSSGAEVTTGYKREHVVDNWKALNQSYKSEYLAGFAVPMDGTNGNPDYLIPGQSENMIPQGLTYWPEKDWVLVSSYDKSKENPSAIFALDRETGAFVAQFNLKKENGKDWKPHAGGIGVSEHNLYITCDRGVAYFPLSDLDVPSGTVKDIKRADYVNFGQLGFGGIVEDVFDVYTAYVNVSDGILWAGNFYSNYPGWSREELIGELIGLLPKSWDNPAALDYNSLVLGFKLSGKTSEAEWNNLKAICDSATYRIGIDNDLQCIQGIAFKKVEGKKYRMYLSRTTNVSFGAEITVTDITLNEKNLKVSKEHCEGFKNLPGTEGIVFIGNDLHILYESGSLAYVGSLGWGTYKDLTDVIWKVNENELLGLIGVRYEGLLNHMGIKYDYDYSDSYFEDSSLNYDHDLAIASYCLAISSMVKEGTGKDGKYGTEELDAARKFFDVTEFDNCQPYGYDKKPETDSIACVIGHKNVVLDGQEETIIAIGIRGAGYGSEWSGNFRLGNSTDHAGFAEARRLVMKYLEQYIEKFGSSFNSNLKFWVTGYSRAAATANLVAATLNNDGDLNGASFQFVNDIKDRYSRGDVYAYTFETPLNTTSKEASDAKYSNIYNFINRIDYVPKVAPSAWDYTRYGENLYMPSLETEGTRYYEYLDEMKKEYEKMTGDKYKENFDFYEVGFFMEGHNLIPDDISLTKVNGYISQSEFLDELIDIVANDVIISADNYVENYEVAARKLMPVIMDGSLDLEITWKDILDEISLLEVTTGKTENMIVRVLAKKIAGAMAVSGLSYDEAYDFLGILDELVSASANNFDYVYTLIENAANIKPAHEPSVNFAWLVSIEPELENALEDGDWYLKFVYNCPIDIALYDENGELLATIIDDEVVFPDDRYLTVYVDSDGQKCFCLPNNTEYRFEILGTDEGTMTCSVSKYDFTENKTTEILNYYDIPVEDGTELTMTVNETIEEELTEKVEITDSEEKIVNYDDHLESEEIETFNVSVTTDTENSYVSGGGTYYKGEYAQVEAVEVGCNKFIGWYIDNTCISTELKYRHPVTESVVIEARFSEKHSMGEWYEILPAACETIGNEQRDCSECDYFETQEIPAVEHNYEAVITPATCYSNGFTTNTCTKCGNGYTFDITAMLTHNFSGWYIVTPATCEASGVEQRDCSACDYSETQNVPATGHNYNNGVCTSCGDDLTANCSCNCHAGGIKGLIFKIILFFQKLFRMNRICEGCGVYHY